MLNNDYKISFEEKNSIFNENIDNNYNVPTSSTFQTEDNYKNISFNLNTLDISKTQKQI
ncbi:hypothetical protein PL321_16600 [Caloramator sp. mosi_1]|uniref:hypothetical protein n=1 Tax=Caloramator sp. mosi_1 TaxID=3023090 RepID=UPI00235FD84B|nr:hypothetical protein [Caloramator sp. mosi_1]WDC83942.1 hypothetical protein PL321_16305 [Caloramator sp. mosi_1]WDC83981.1 hypothetical protein PL321_16600 [Caloramator sp. mosi_1]